MTGRLILSARERATLWAVCDTLLPAMEPPPGITDADWIAYWRRSAADLDVAGAVEESLWLETTPAQQRRLRLALRVLGSPPLQALLTGRARTFGTRSLAARTRVLRGWAEGPLPPLRQAHQAFKRLAAAHFYAHPGPDGTNPNAAVLGYPGRAPAPAAPAANSAHPLQPLAVGHPQVIEADVCVIGSGAGGAVAAALWAGAGRRVIVLETGGWSTEADFDAREERGWERLYLRRGLQTTDDGGILVLAGRTLGGGTTVNWSTSFRPPEARLAEWAAQTGIPDLTGPDLAAAFDAVERRLHVCVPSVPLNANNAVLWDGATALGLPVARMPTNAAGTGDCGVCHFGCRQGDKQSTVRTYLQDAYDAGAQILPNCEAERVLLAGGRAVGVQAWVHPPAEARDRQSPGIAVTVRAPIVIVAAGALHTPAILLRSGLRHPQIGRNLYLHPSTAVAGRFATRVEGWTGLVQSAYSPAFADLTGDGYGFYLEAAPLYPGLAAGALPWAGGRAFRALMADLPYTSAIIALTRDRVPGRVVIDRQGAARLLYQPSAESRRLLVRGCREAARVTLAAGARDVYTLHTPPIRLRPGDDLAAFDARVAAAGARPDRLFVASAHQMGTARLGADPASSVVDARGQVHGVPGVYIADGALLPSAPGVNPMIGIMGLAHWLTSRNL